MQIFQKVLLIIFLFQNSKQSSDKKSGYDNPYDKIFS